MAFAIISFLVELPLLSLRKYITCLISKLYCIGYLAIFSIKKLKIYVIDAISYAESD